MSDLVDRQRDFFASGQTRPAAFRERMLECLAEAISDYEEKILAALAADLGKSATEGYTTEVGPCLAEIRHARRHLRRWMKPRRVAGSKWFPLSRGRIVPEPLGVCLIVAPWNYPFALTIAPLVADIAAGNCAVLKPSELAPHTAQIIAEMIPEYFDEEYIRVVCGGPETSQELLRERWDHIFYTGGEKIARLVLTAAAQNITPATLELGGKSPCLVSDDCDMAKTARRIVWGKFLNAGQTCVAPDYLLVHRDVREELIGRLRGCITEFYGPNPQDSRDYGRIIHQRHFDRLVALMGEAKVICGGQTDRERLYIAPTLLEAGPAGGKIMEEEIFGPLLPILEYRDIGEALDFIRRRPKPLALYIFSRSRRLQQKIISETSSGGVCVNDTVVHLTSHTLPFGGVGTSGFGRYHGRAGFDAVSNPKSVLHQTLLFDIPKRFPPRSERDLNFLRRLLR